MAFAAKDLSSLNMLGKNLGEAVQNQFRNDLQAANMERENTRRTKVQSVLSDLNTNLTNPSLTPVQRNIERTKASTTLSLLGENIPADRLGFERDNTNTTPWESYQGAKTPEEKSKVLENINSFTKATTKQGAPKIIKSSKVITNDKGEQIVQELANIYSGGTLMGQQKIGEKPYVSPLAGVNARIFDSGHKAENEVEQRDIDRILKIQDDIKQVQLKKQEADFLIESGQITDENALSAAEKQSDVLQSMLNKYNDDISGIVKNHKNWKQKDGVTPAEKPTEKKVDDPLGIL